jgi:hypothetical protein
MALSFRPEHHVLSRTRVAADDKRIVRSWVGVRVWDTTSATELHVFKSDASGDSHADAGFGAWYGGEALVGRWAKPIIGKSTTALELAPVLQAMKLWGARWKNSLVAVGLDNVNAFFGINSGRAKKDDVSNDLLMRIFDVCFEFNIDLVASWVPRDDNQTSDDLSKLPIAALKSRFPSLHEVADPFVRSPL